MIVTPAPYLPFLEPHRDKPPGLWPLDPAEWIEIDAAYAAQMAYRDRLIAAKGEAVAAALPEAGAAVTELRAMLETHLFSRFHDRFIREGVGDGVRRADGAVVAGAGAGPLGRLAQEDFCLLARRAEGEEYRLIAASLCFPSRWSLSEKLGRPLTPIHDPVPDYAQDLAKRVNRMFEALHQARPVQRLNWSVLGTDELHLVARATEAKLTGPFFLRVERQTLRRLPETGAVVFGIKTYVTPLADLPQAARADLHARIADMPPAEAAYKGGEAWRAAALQSLLSTLSGS